jgi:hypothetical protein
MVQMGRSPLRYSPPEKFLPNDIRVAWCATRGPSALVRKMNGTRTTTPMRKIYLDIYVNADHRKVLPLKLLTHLN